MKIITLTQPWATLVAIGAKRVETRGWRTAYRGWLAIHAAKSFPPSAVDLCATEPFRSALLSVGLKTAIQLPTSKIIAVTMLQNVVRTVDARAWATAQEIAFGDYSDGRFAFVFGAAAVPLKEPIEARGMLGLWNPDARIAAELRRQGFDA